MLTLSILRHAKSSWTDASLKDFDRPLSKRGERAAPAIGAFMREQDLEPQAVLASPAVRVRQTLEHVLPELTTEPQVTYDQDLYLAGPTTWLAKLHEMPKSARRVLIAGHNPGLHALALDLVAEGPRDLIAALARKLPTAGLVVIALRTKVWSTVMPATGRLELYMTPSRLPDSRQGP